MVATLQNSSGKGITGKSLSFMINGQNYAVKTDSNGKATLTLPNLNPGTYSCIIKYSGDKINGTCSKTIDITVNKIPTSIYAYGLNLTYGRDSKILVNVEDYNGNILEGKRVYLIMGNAPRGLLILKVGLVVFLFLEFIIVIFHFWGMIIMRHLVN